MTLSLIIYSQQINAQNPFKKFGYEVKVLTMSNGKFNEFFDLDTIQQIGEVLFNTNSMKVVGFVKKDTTNPMPDPQLISRWVSPDPLAEEYYSISPYAYVANNPIKYIDPDGTWIPGFDEKGNIHLIREKGDTRWSLRRQFKKSGYKISRGQAKEWAKTARKGEGTINLTEKAEEISPELVTELNHLKEQFNHANETPEGYNSDIDQPSPPDKGKTGSQKNCVMYSTNTPKTDNKVVAFDWPYSNNDWKTKALEMYNSDNFTEGTKGDLKIASTRFAYLKNGDIRHGARFLWKGRGGKTYSVHKYGPTKGMFISRTMYPNPNFPKMKWKDVLLRVYNPQK